MLKSKLLTIVFLISITLLVSLCANRMIPGSLEKSTILPLPSSIGLKAYEKQLYTFLDNNEYKRLKWHHDKTIRNTGPYVNDVYYGTHPAVLIYYSPEVYTWLKNDRRGEIPDGAMIIKIMYDPPAQRYANLSPEAILNMESDTNALEGWTVMIKDKNGSKDGWFWSYYGRGQKIDQLNEHPFDYPNSGFGNYCVRCHASANSEFTFSSLTNIEGEEGEPITYYVDESWKDDDPGEGYVSSHELLAKGMPEEVGFASFQAKRTYVNQSFLNVFGRDNLVSREEVKVFPPETYDHVVAGPAPMKRQFLTSDQCLSCHDGQTGNFLPNMVVDFQGEKQNVSPYGEWRWSMMGLAGRDPIFYAQLESEKAIHNQKNLPNVIQDICFRCHGVMGQRQFHIDNPKNDALFKEEHIFQYDYEQSKGELGALARDGISCMSCHQIIDDKGPLQDIETGMFKISEPGKIFGPFKNPPVHPMEEALGLTPTHSEYVKSSRLCASCHTINLPVYNDKGDSVGMHYEQATYLEWVNSSYQNEYIPIGENSTSCQDCHMPKSFPLNSGNALNFKIANIQDQDYPESDHLVDREWVTLENRRDYSRHTLLGINIYGLEMFNQFDDILGVRKKDYMTGLDNGLSNAINNANRLAKKHSVKVAVTHLKHDGKHLTARVNVTNLVGHRFPSGVGFRRAFLQLAVISHAGDTIWASGRTNSVGVVVDENGSPLPSEFLEVGEDGEQQYQRHYQEITAQNQVQIYQELVKNPEGKFTTSFVAINSVPKDNRLLPKGWSKEGPKGFAPAFIEATSPHGEATKDTLYMSGRGQDAIDYKMVIPKEKLKDGKVVATMYYQSIPPFYLKQRFETANGDNGNRLFYLASHLKTTGTAIENWRLVTGWDEKEIPMW